MRTPSSRFLRLSRAASSVAITCVFLALLGLSACGGGNSTLSLGKGPAHPCQPAQTNQPSSQPRWWLRDIVAVGIVQDSGAAPVNAGAIAQEINQKVFGGALTVAAVPGEPIPSPQVQFASAADVFLKLQGTTGNDAVDDAALTKVIDTINSSSIVANGTPVFDGKTVIAGASPDWMMMGSPNDYIGGSPSGPPCLLDPDNVKRWDNQSSTGNGTGTTVAVLDAAPNRTSSLPDEGSYTSLGGNSQYFKYHGPFVVGLIKHLAPGATVQLYRVLNDQGVGDMATLINALHAVPSDAFVNLSLSVEVNDSLVTSNPALYWGRLLAPLALAAESAVHRGNKIVAAAGNDSSSGSTPYDADAPASFCGVTAVAAIDVNSNSLAAFSNFPWEGGSKGHQCLDVSLTFSDWKQGGSSNKQSITTGSQPASGPGLFAPGVQVCSVYAVSPSGYALWDGTSFATGLVTGTIAQSGNIPSASSLINPGQPCTNRF